MSLAFDALMGASNYEARAAVVPMLTFGTELRQLNRTNIACKLNPSYLVSR